jgi:hypothetical protein
VEFRPFLAKMRHVAPGDCRKTGPPLQLTKTPAGFPAGFRKASLMIRQPLHPLLFVLLALGCGSTAANPEPDTGTRAVIENRSSLDMDIDVRRNDGRVSRLGFAPGNETTSFALTPTVTAGAAWIRFEARPTRGGDPVVSEPFQVRAGEEISWSVPPQ